MSQIEVTKVAAYVVIAPPADQAVVSKLAMYVVLVPGGDGGLGSGSQGHVHTQILRRS